MRFRKVLYLIGVLYACLAAPCFAQNTADSSSYTSEQTAPSDQSDAERLPLREIVYNKSGPNDRQWKNSSSNAAYGYRDKQEAEPAKKEAPHKDPAWLLGLLQFIHWLQSTAGQVFLWSALVLIVGYIAYRIIAGSEGGFFGRRDRRDDSKEDATQINDESFLDDNWDERLRAARSAGDTRAIVRYSYMATLQAMQLRGLITFRPDKTNTAYYQELTESLKAPFREISRTYEYAWYGNFLPDKVLLGKFMQTYEGLKKSIQYA